MRKNQKGRSTSGPPFSAVHHYLQDSPAWLSLPPAPRAVYLALARLYNGSNNGRLGLGARRAAELCNISKNTSTICFRTLLERGFIECATPGGFSQKSRHQTEWRLTAYRCDVTGASASKTFMKWRPNSDHGPNPMPVRSQIRDRKPAMAA